MLKLEKGPGEGSEEDPRNPCTSDTVAHQDDLPAMLT